MRFVVELGNDVRYLMMIAVSMIPPNKEQGYSKQEAIVLGLMIRISKLYDALCYHVSEGQGEIAAIFNRLIFESYVRMPYLIKNGPDSADNFIFISYQSIKESYQDLLAKKAQRKLIPIEARLIRKYELQLEEDGIEKEKVVKISANINRHIILTSKFMNNGRCRFNFLIKWQQSFSGNADGNQNFTRGIARTP